VWSPAYGAYPGLCAASHYGFASDFCHANDQQSKGIVEILRSSTTWLRRFDPGRHRRRSVDLRVANAAAKTWRAEVNAAVHSEICAVSDEQLIAEREVLQPLPSLRLQIGVPSVLRKVDRLSCVRYASARYSVPTG
jgi:hypothetical protein